MRRTSDRGQEALRCAPEKRKVHINTKPGGHHGGRPPGKQRLSSGNKLGMLGSMEMALQHRAQYSHV